MFVNHERVKAIKEKYPSGTRIKLINMNDKKGIDPGTEGTVSHVDDIGTIHMKWDNGRVLGLIEGEDSFKIIHKEDK